MAPTGKDVLLVVLQVAPAVIISAGINFAVAYAMYHSQSNINFWPFPNTIAGDLAVTNFIQGALNYIVPSATLEADSRLGKAVPWRGLWNPPLSLVDRISRLSGRKRQLWELLVQSEDILAPPLRPKTVFKKLFLAILRGLFLSVFLFLITWSLAVAIACPIYCGDNIAGTWGPQGIKAIYGGVHALIEIPLASFLIVLGMDVRNHRMQAHPDSKGVLANSSTNNGNVGFVQDGQTGQFVPIDTRTNTPLSEQV